MSSCFAKAMSRRILWSYSINKVKQSQGIAALMLYPRCVPPERRIHSDIKKLTDKIKETNNPFFDKYREKIEKVGGLTDEYESPLPSTQPSPCPASAVNHYPFIEPPSLNKIMIVDRILDKSPEEITKIWKEYHSDKYSVSAVIPADVYVQLQAKASMCPLFVLPLPRDEGFEFMFSQFNGHQFYFTPLLNFQLHQENAPVCLNLCHFTELKESKGIVLMNGEYDMQVLKPLEAQFLANQIQLYYASIDQECFNLVKQFNRQPDEFEYQKLIDQLQDSGIGLHQTQDK